MECIFLATSAKCAMPVNRPTAVKELILTLLSVGVHFQATMEAALKEERRKTEEAVTEAMKMAREEMKAYADERCRVRIR